MSRLELHQHKSAIGEKRSAKGTLQALGLKRTGARVSHEDTPALRGMLRKVAHLVEIVEGKTAR